MGPRNRSTERASLKYLKPLFKYIKKYIVLFIIAMAFAVGGTVLTVIGPRLISRITDIISEGLMLPQIDMQAVISVATTLIFLYLASIIMSYLQGFIMATITQNTAYGLRHELIQICPAFIRQNVFRIIVIILKVIEEVLPHLLDIR